MRWLEALESLSSSSELKRKRREDEVDSKNLIHLKSIGEKDI